MKNEDNSPQNIWDKENAIENRPNCFTVKRNKDKDYCLHNILNNLNIWPSIKR